MAGYYLRQRFPIGQPVVLDQTRGEVSGIGGVSTVVATPESQVVIPNGLLLDSVVQMPTQPPQSKRPADRAP